MLRKRRILDMLKKFVCSVAFLLLAPSVMAIPPNTTAANATAYEIGQGWVSHYFDESATNRWFNFPAIGGRSYCLEAVLGSDTVVQLNPTLDVYSGQGGYPGRTLMGSSAYQEVDPPLYLGARYCFVENAVNLGQGNWHSVNVKVPIAAGSGDNGYVRLRIYDTTIVAAMPVTNASGTPTGNHVGLFNLGNFSVSYMVRAVCSSDANGVNGRIVSPLTVATLAADQIIAVVPPCAGSYGGVAYAWARVWIAVPAPTNRIFATLQRNDLPGQAPIKLNP
jgi:hypothetical protein